MQDKQNTILYIKSDWFNIKMLRKNITTTFWAKIASLLRSFKQLMDLLHIPGLYKVSCEYGKVYIGETTGTVSARQFERKRHLRLLHPEKI